MQERPTLTVNERKLVWRFADGRVLPYVGGGSGPLGVLDREIEGLRGEIHAAESEAQSKRDIADKLRDDAIAAGKNPLTDDALFDEYDARTKESDSARDRALVLRKRESEALARIASERGGDRPSDPTSRPLNRSERREFNAIAKRVLDSPEYRALREGGRLDQGQAHINTNPVEVVERDGLSDELRQRTTVSVSNAGSLVPIDQQVWPPIELPVRQLRVLDLISIVTTESDQVNWVQQTVRGDVAAITAYGTVAPEADYEFALKTATVKRLPQFVPATKDVIADRGQLQGLLQDQLMYGVRLGLENEVLSGAGANPSDPAHFQGILNAPGIGTLAMGGVAGEYALDAVHRAITTIRLTLFADPTAIGLHPTDYEHIILKKDTVGRYIYPVASETNTIWGLAPIITPAFTLGTAVVGDFKVGARLWLRTGLSVTMSTEHADFFTRGMVAILAEMRAAFAVVQPRAFCTVTALVA